MTSVQHTDDRLSPCSWLVENLDLLTAGSEVLDLACGRGRHAIFLAAAGFGVRAVDVDGEHIQTVRGLAAKRGLDIDTEVVDLEIEGRGLGEGVHDVILGIHYLHRPLFPALIRALRPGGLLVYETFTVDQALIGRPRNPDFLLEKGELPRLVRPLDVLRQREGEFDGRRVAGIVAQRRPREPGDARDD